MKTYKLSVPWAGYSRGEAIVEVKASSLEEAIENIYDGEEIERFTVRDDTEWDTSDVTEIK